MKFPHEYMAIPFVDGGRDKQGVDCWGLVFLVFKEQLGVDLPEYGEISAKDLISISRMVDGQRFGDKWVKKSEPQAFDVVVMRAHDSVNGKQSRVSSHVGIMVNDDKMLHIEEAVGSSIVSINSPLVKHRIVGFYDYAG